MAPIKKKKAAPSPKAKPEKSKTLRIATFNANSIRVRMGIILDWLKKNQPDVLAVQETKVQDFEFPQRAHRIGRMAGDLQRTKKLQRGRLHFQEAPDEYREAALPQGRGGTGAFFSG